MGMYDYLKCHYPLPDPEFQSDQFQTKDLDCELKVYEITVNGKLIKNEYDTEITPKEERPFPNAPENSWKSIFGIMRTVKGSERQIEVTFDSDLFFYKSMPTGTWIEYRARFDDGQLLSIKRIPRK
jgi:hypothetical protein